MRSASDWKTRASMYMPVPAISQAIAAPIGPVAPAKVRGSEKMPAPTMPPTTIMVRANRESFWVVCELAELSPPYVCAVIRTSSPVSWPRRDARR